MLQVTAAFVLFVSTCYTQLGPMISKSLEDTTEAVYDDLKKMDDAIKRQIEMGITHDKSVLDLEKYFKSLYAITDDIAAGQAAVDTAAAGKIDSSYVLLLLLLRPSLLVVRLLDKP